MNQRNSVSRKESCEVSDLRKKVSDLWASQEKVEKCNRRKQKEKKMNDRFRA